MLRPGFVLGACAVLAATLAAALALHAQTAPQFPLRTAQRVQTFGDSDSDGGNYVLSSIAAVAVGPAGQVYVLDRKDADIKLFTAAGRFVRIIGRRGSGPGELTGPAFRLEVDDDEVRVADLMLRRDVVFSLEGKHVRTRNHPQSDGAPKTSREVRPGWTLSVSPPNATISSAARRSDPFHRVTLQSAGGRVDTLAEIRADIADMDMLRQGKPLMPNVESLGVGDGGAHALYRDTLLAVIDGYAGTVKWIGFGAKGPEVRRSARIAAGGQPLSQRELNAAARKAEQLRRKHYGEINVRFSNLPRHSSATRALFAADGALWIAAPAANDATLWTVFPQREAPFSVKLPASFTLTAVRGQRLYGHGVGRDDVPLVVVYELR